MIFITEQDVLNLLKWDDTFRAISTAMVKVSKDRVDQKARTFTQVLSNKNLLLTMPGYLEDDTFGALACKLVTACPNNVNLEEPLPTINANIMIFEEVTGIAKAVIAGTEITKWRTAAASAVATKHIYVNRSKQCKILAVLGCGAQGQIHAEAFQHFFNFEEIRLWNRHADKARSLAEKLNKKVSGNVFKHVDNSEQCVKDADVIVTATYASSPIVKYERVKQGAHINAIGAGVSHYSELDENLYLNSDVYIDHWAGARQELGGLEKLGVNFKGEIGGVVTGDVLLPDASSNRTTIFQSLGMAVEDCAVARLVYDLYMKKDKNL